MTRREGIETVWTLLVEGRRAGRPQIEVARDLAAKIPDLESAGLDIDICFAVSRLADRGRTLDQTLAELEKELN